MRPLLMALLCLAACKREAPPDPGATPVDPGQPAAATCNICDGSGRVMIDNVVDMCPRCKPGQSKHGIVMCGTCKGTGQFGNPSFGKKEQCSQCWGRGCVAIGRADVMSTCTTCGGTGKVMYRGPRGETRYNGCGICNGSGKVVR